MKYIVVSDLHLSTDEYLDDFYSDEEFSQMLKMIGGGEATTLVLNGDTIDFLQSSPEDSSTHNRATSIYCDSDMAVKMLERVLRRHKLFFDALSEFLSKSENKLVVLKGNHDAEFAFDSVKNRFVQILGEQYRERIIFPEYGYYIEEKGVYIEHGNQYDKLNSFSNFQMPFADLKRRRIELPFGSILVRTLWNRLEKSFPYIDKIRPMTSSITLALAQRPLFWVFRFDYFMGMFLHMARRDFSLSNLIKRSVDESRLTLPERVSASQTNLLQFGGTTLLSFIFMIAFFFIKGLFFLDVNRRKDVSAAIDFTYTSLLGFFTYIGIALGVYIVAKVIIRFLGDKPNIAYPINTIYRLLVGTTFGFILFAFAKFFWIPIVIALLILLIIDMHRSITRDISFEVEDIEKPFPEEIRAAKKILKLDRVRFVIFGHTHLPRVLIIDEQKYLINSGTWIFNLDLYSLENRNFMQTFVLIENESVSLNVFYGIKGFSTIKRIETK